MWPTSAQTRPISAKRGRTSAQISPSMTESGLILPFCVEFGSKLARKVDQTGPNPTDSGPVEIDPKFAKLPPWFGRNWAKLGRICGNLGQVLRMLPKVGRSQSNLGQC